MVKNYSIYLNKESKNVIALLNKIKNNKIANFNILCEKEL